MGNPLKAPGENYFRVSKPTSLVVSPNARQKEAALSTYAQKYHRNIKVE